VKVKKAELIVKPSPSGDPILRGACSSCPDITFIIVGDTEENRRLMQQMFDKHFVDAHLHTEG
jgi:hypothetical protein